MISLSIQLAIVARRQTPLVLTVSRGPMTCAAMRRATPCEFISLSRGACSYSIVSDKDYCIDFPNYIQLFNFSFPLYIDQGILIHIELQHNCENSYYDLINFEEL